MSLPKGDPYFHRNKYFSVAIKVGAKSLCNDNLKILYLTNPEKALQLKINLNNEKKDGKPNF